MHPNPKTGIWCSSVLCPLFATKNILEHQTWNDFVLMNDGTLQVYEAWSDLVSYPIRWSLYSHTVQVIEAKSGWNQQRSKNCQRISAPFVCHQVYFVLQLRLGFLLNCFFVHKKVVVMIKVSWKKTKYVTCSSWAVRACAQKCSARIRSICDNAWQG